MFEVTHDNYKRLKLLICIINLIFDRENGSLECANRATRNYRQWQTVPVEYHMREKTILILWSSARSDKKKKKNTCVVILE